MRAAELGASPVVYEKGPAPGGSMRLSSGVVWRYRDLAAFRAECPNGDPELQRLVIERLDASLDWLEWLGAPVVARSTGNPRTVGRRFEPAGLTDALARRVPDLRLGTPLTELPDGVPVVLATGGFQGDAPLVERYVGPAAPLVLRANPWSTGDGLRAALVRGAGLSAGMEEFYGRAMPASPARISPDRFVALAQVYARFATVEALDGERYPPDGVRWHETDVVQWMARKPDARAWYSVADERLSEPAGPGTVADAIERARAAGGVVERVDGSTRVLVSAAITATLGGLRVDDRARVLDASGTPLENLYAAGGDVGGISTGGWSSGLAAALVLGRVAAESALGARNGD